jgi:hypothetical protein
MNHWEAYMLAEENKDLLDIHTNFVNSGRHKDTAGHMLKGGLYTLAFSEYVKEYIENNKDTLTEK